MSRHFIFNVLLLSACIGALHIYDLNHRNELTIERAVAPLEHLSNARHAINDRNVNKSIEEIDHAITAMRIIKKFADTTAAAHVSDAINDLKLVENEIENDSVVIADLNNAFFNALNSIALANLTISEANLAHGSKYKAMNLVNASFRELISSMKFANTEEQKKQEEKVIADVRDFLQQLKDANYHDDLHNEEKLLHKYDTLSEEVEELIH